MVAAINSGILNFRGFRGLRAIRESFLREIWGRAAPAMLFTNNS